jgi:hypothetical protein
MTNITLFSQIINRLDRHDFSSLVKKHQSDKHQKGINSWTHLVSMLFCHFSKANSLREITNGLKSATGNLNHLGFMHKTPSKSSMSYINEHRNWEVFRDYYYQLLGMFQADADFKQTKFKIKNKKILILDSTTITLCLSLYNWASYSQTKGAIKLHALLDYDGCLPVYVHITDGKKSDVEIAKQMDFPKNSVIVADRGYLDFEMLNRWDSKGINFVLRLRDDVRYIDMKENPLPEATDQHILKDERILLTNKESREKYPEQLRRIAVYDSQNNQTIILITNNFSWTASTIAELYKQRWQIEIFFKILKTHLKIKSFVGTSCNAVLIQIWTALITLLILKYLKQIGKYNWCLSNLIAFLRMNLFVKISLQEWLDEPFKPPEDDIYKQLQVNLF